MAPKQKRRSCDLGMAGLLRETLHEQAEAVGATNGGVVIERRIIPVGPNTTDPSLNDTAPGCLRQRPHLGVPVDTPAEPPIDRDNHCPDMTDFFRQEEPTVDLHVFRDE